jgi:hypothetical protein
MQISYINSYSNNCGVTTTVVVTLVVVLVAMVGELKCASLARTVDTLKGRGDLTQALAAARHQLCEESIKRMQSDSNAALYQQLASEEQARRANALKQVADLQVTFSIHLTGSYSISAGNMHETVTVIMDVQTLCQDKRVAQAMLHYEY